MPHNEITKGAHRPTKREAVENHVSDKEIKAASNPPEGERKCNHKFNGDYPPKCLRCGVQATAHQSDCNCVACDAFRENKKAKSTPPEKEWWEELMQVCVDAGVSFPAEWGEIKYLVEKISSLSRTQALKEAGEEANKGVFKIANSKETLSAKKTMEYNKGLCDGFELARNHGVSMAKLTVKAIEGLNK